MEVTEAEAMAALRRRGWLPNYIAVRTRFDLQSPAAAVAGDAALVLGVAPAWHDKTDRSEVCRLYWDTVWGISGPGMDLLRD